MPSYTVRVFASQIISVEAEDEEQAKELASENSYFSAVDYCEIEEIEE